MWLDIGFQIYVGETGEEKQKLKNMLHLPTFWQYASWDVVIFLFADNIHCLFLLFATHLFQD